MASTAANGNTSYPTTIDTADTFGASESRNTINLANWLSRFWAAIIALETKIGITAGTVSGTISYILLNIPSGDRAVSKTGTEILTNKTLTSPAITTPTGIVKGDVGLGNVDNTSDATKWAQTVVVTNKSFSDSTNWFVNNADNTKRLNVSVLGTTAITGVLRSNFTTAKTLDLPDATDTLVGKATTDTLTNKRINKRVTTITSSSTPTPAGDTSDEFTVTALAVGATFAAPTGTPVEGQDLVIRIKDNATPQTLAWNAIYRFSSDLIAPTTTVASKTLYMGFRYNATDSKWDCLAQLNNF